MWKLPQSLLLMRALLLIAAPLIALLLTNPRRILKDYLAAQLFSAVWLFFEETVPSAAQFTAGYIVTTGLILLAAMAIAWKVANLRAFVIGGILAGALTWYTARQLAAVGFTDYLLLGEGAILVALGVTVVLAAIEAKSKLVLLILGSYWILAGLFDFAWELNWQAWQGLDWLFPAVLCVGSNFVLAWKLPKRHGHLRTASPR